MPMIRPVALACLALFLGALSAAPASATASPRMDPLEVNYPYVETSHSYFVRVVSTLHDDCTAQRHKRTNAIGFEINYGHGWTPIRIAIPPGTSSTTRAAEGVTSQRTFMVNVFAFTRYIVRDGAFLTGVKLRVAPRSRVVCGLRTYRPKTAPVELTGVNPQPMGSSQTTGG